MKRTARCLISLLLLAALSPCALAQSTILGGLWNALFGGSTGTLWDSRVQIDIIPLEASCLSQGDRLLGLSRDGRRALIASSDGPVFLADLETEARTDLFSATPQVLTEAMARLSPAQDQAVPTLSEYFTALSASLGRPAPLWFVPSHVLQGDENTLRLWDTQARAWTIDCGTGAAYGPLPSSMSVYGGQGLYLDGPGKPMIMDLATGTAQPLTIPAPADQYPDGAAALSVGFVGQCGMAAMLRTSRLDRANGQTCELAVYKGGEWARYSLATQIFGRETSSIMPVNDRFVLLYSNAAAQITMPILVDLTTGQSLCLYSMPERDHYTLCAAPLSDCLNESGIPTLPETARGLLPLGPMEDGTCLMVQLLGAGEIALLRPDTGETCLLKDESGEPLGLPLMQGFTTDGHTRVVTALMPGVPGHETDLDYVRLSPR